MKTLFNFLVFTILLASTSCSNKEGSKNNYLVPIDVSNEKIENFSELFSEIEYTVFPSEASVIRVDKAQKFENYFIFGDYDISNSISIIDSNFTTSKNILAIGGGPGEYARILDFTINKTVGTVDVLTLNKLISYDFNGKFIKEIKLPGSVGKIVHVKEDDYVIYREKSLHSNFPGPDEQSILWVWNTTNNTTSRIPSGSENIKFPFFMERNNLNFQNNNVIFSTNFLDTVYVFSNNLELKEKRYFSGDRKYMPINLITKHNGVFPSEIESNYYFHLPNILENQNLFITTLRIEGYFNSYIYSKTNNKGIIFSNPTNDIDGGFPFIPIVLLDEKYIYSAVESNYLIEHLEQNNINSESQFYQFASKLNINSPLVLTKYKLKSF